MAGLLLDEIERDALDENASVAAALRKYVALGGRNGSEALRDWATRELDGYRDSDEIPDYRVVPAVIQLDAMVPGGQITGQGVAPSSLPKVVRERIKEKVELLEGIGQIEDLAKRSEIKIGLPAGADLVRLMNHEIGSPHQRIDRIYWSVSPVAVRGVVDHVRNALVKLVAEIRASTPSGQDLPSGAAADQAMNFVITGRRARVNVTASQASGPGSSAATSVAPTPEPERGFWTTWRKIGAAIAGIAGIAGAVFGGIQAF
jgi:hypothetical protein